MDPNQRQRKRGAVDRINSAVNTAKNLRNAVRLARTAATVGRTAATAAATSEIWIPAVIIGVIVLIIIFTVIILMGSGGSAGNLGAGQNGGPTPGGGGDTSADISTCSFYRGGSASVMVTFGNPQMATLVSEISNKVGVPPAGVAGIMRVESEEAFTRTDPSYLAGDYDDNCSIVGGVPVACGIMQIVPSTFTGVFNNNAAEMNSLFGKTQARAVIDPKGSVYPISYFRIYSIRDSIIATAFLIKNNKRDINGDGPWDQATISKIAAAYYSGDPNGCTKYPSCSTGPNDYGEDVWNSYVNCQVTSLASSCPLKNNQQITCGSFMSDPQFNQSACSGPNPIDRGHCGQTYGSCFKGTVEATNDQRRAHSIDVPAAPGTPVYLPTINNQTVSWNYVTNYFVLSSEGGGYGYVFIATAGSDIWELRLLHLSPPPLIPPSDGTTYKSGDVVTTIAATSYPHVHINIGKNPEREDG